MYIIFRSSCKPEVENHFCRQSVSLDWQSLNRTLLHFLAKKVPLNKYLALTNHMSLIPWPPVMLKTHRHMLQPW